MRPALLKRVQYSGATVREAELGAQTVLEGTLALTCLWPLHVGDPTQMALEGRCIPHQIARFKEGDPLSIPQEVGLPVLAAAHAAIAGFHGADEALQVIVGARQARSCRPGKQVRVHAREHADEMRQTLRIGGWQSTGAARHAIAPRGKGLFLILLSLDPRFSCPAEQPVGFEQPRLPRAQTGEIGGKGRTQAEDRAQPVQPVRAPVGDDSPFFAPCTRRSKLCSTSPSASSIATAPKRKGCSPSRLISACRPAAYSAKMRA